MEEGIKNDMLNYGVADDRVYGRVTWRIRTHKADLKWMRLLADNDNDTACPYPDVFFWFTKSDTSNLAKHRDLDPYPCNIDKSQ